jgi:membrane associated rhomboid family serine protease
VEAQTDIQTYLERGKQALAQGDGQEAAIAYAHGAQIEPENPMVHLGLAEANVARGDYRVARMACRRVQELEPASGTESLVAQALLDLLEHRYDRALQSVDAAIAQEPGIGYMHALRSYLLRATKQEYDANLARARAARLSYGAHYDNCFPPLEPAYATGYSVQTPPPYNIDPIDPNTLNGNRTVDVPQQESEQVPTWSRPNGMQRQMVRTRFALSRYPNLMTYTIIAINVIVFVLTLLFPNTDFGVQDNSLVMQGQYWRIFTAMFLHASIFHIGLNMLSLFFIGPAVEMLYGKWRYLLIYLLSGIVGGITTYLISVYDPSFVGTSQSVVGASGAIFGVFGALGTFFIFNRNARGMIGQWLFWLGLNLFWGFIPGSGIAIWDHIGGLIAGFLLALLLTVSIRRRRRT